MYEQNKIFFIITDLWKKYFIILLFNHNIFLHHLIYIKFMNVIIQPF
jgi:hypothetical protein